MSEMIGLIALSAACVWVSREWAGVVDRAIAAYTQTHTPPAPPAPKAPEPVPNDILSMAYEQREEWARDSVVARARELFDELKDWGMVSHQLSQELSTP